MRERFNQGKGGTIWYYGELARTFQELLPGQIADEFGGIIEVRKEPG